MIKFQVQISESNVQSQITGSNFIVNFQSQISGSGFKLQVPVLGSDFRRKFHCQIL